LIICLGNLKVVTWKAPSQLTFEMVLASRPTSLILSRLVPAS
jgi:hypothetical protein